MRRCASICRPVRTASVSKPTAGPTLTVGNVAGAEVTQSADLDRAVQTGSSFVRSIQPAPGAGRQ
jgi:hypothetical protein